MDDSEIKNQRPAGVFRRFAAMTYDALLLIAVLLLALAIALAINGGEELPRSVARLVVVLVIFLFFYFFWSRGGQTLGMQTWRLHLEIQDGAGISVKQSALRTLGALLSFACLGLGYFWLWFDREQRAWPDIISGTRVVHRPKKKKNKASKQNT